jgi:hypothetical protein
MVEDNREEKKSATLRLAEEVKRRPFTAAAIVGGAAAATAGAVFGARALAKRNGGTVNPVLQTAITACEAAAMSNGGDHPAPATSPGDEIQAHPS